MRFKSKQHGFSAVELLLVVLVIGVLAGIGYLYYDRTQDSSSNQTSTPTGSNVAEAPEIKESADLDKALNALDQNDPDASNSSDNAQLDSQLSGF